MKRRLTFYMHGGLHFGTDVEHESAEMILNSWRGAVQGESEQVIAQVDGTPVFHMDLAAVQAISDEIA